MARVVVFKDHADLLDLRGLLFGPPAAQKIGIRKCRAYEVRGPLPPSIHATCLLVAAKTDDALGLCDSYVTRQAYAMALIRFVNEILDAAQVGRSVVPLHTLAVEANLPSAFVELRHAATHEGLPSIHVLREMAKKALRWLYDEFWSLQDAVGPSVGPSPGRSAAASASVSTRASPRVSPRPAAEERVEDAIKDAFREWRRVKRDNAQARVPAALGDRLRSEFLQHGSELLSVVLTRNIVVPAGSGPIKKRDAVIKLWKPVFMYIGREFCTLLSDRIVAELQEQEWPVVGTSTHRKYAMLEHWATELVDFVSPVGLSAISSRPRPWNALLLAKYASVNARPDLWRTAEQMAFVTGVELAEPEPKEPQGWSLVSPWTPTPVGME